MSSVDEELPTTLPRWEMPSDWQWVSIADVGKVITGNTPPTKDESNYGDFIPFVKPPALTDKGIRSTSEGLSETGAQSSRTLPIGAVLVSCIGGLGKTGIAKVPVAFNQQINAIVFDQRVIPEFGFYYSQTLKPWLHGVASATTLPIVNKGKFQRAPFPLAPLEQQKRIVAEIEKKFSRLDEAVANLKRVKANLKRYKAAVLKAAVEGRLVETEAELARREGRSYETGTQLLQRILENRRSQWAGKGKYKEPAAPVTTDLPDFPEGWVWASLDQLSWDSGYGTSVKCAYENDGPPVLRIPNVDKAAIDLSDVKYAPSAFSVSEIEALSPGDMLVIRTNGSKSLIGRAAIVMTRFQQPTTYASYLIRFRLHDDENLSAWVLSYWQSHSSRLWIESKAATSAGQHNISMSVLATAPVPLAPAAEHRRIVAEVDRRLSFLRETEAQVDANLRRAERLRHSILANAFTGKLISNRDEPVQRCGRDCESSPSLLRSWSS